MKKGIQYSHYCGAELQELCCSIDLANDHAEKGETAEAQKWLKYAQEMTNKLRLKISDLDKLNELKF